MARRPKEKSTEASDRREWQVVLAGMAWFLFLATRLAVPLWPDNLPGAAGSPAGWLWPGWGWLLLLAVACATASVGAFAAMSWFLARRGLPREEARKVAAQALIPSFALLALPLMELAQVLCSPLLAPLALARELWPAFALAALALAGARFSLALPQPVLRPAPPPRRWLAWAVFAVALLVFLGAGERLARVADRTGPFLAGDEPSYLLLTHSLAMDHDLDLTNNLKNQDSRFFLPPGRQSDGHARPGAAGGMYSPHRPGLPLLMAPAYALGLEFGINPRRAALLVVCLLAAWLVAESFLLARRAAWQDGWALAAAAAACLLPLLHYANLIFPEVAAGALAVASLRRLLRRQPAWWTLLAAGIFAAGLGWMHERFLLLAFTLAGVAWFRRKQLSGAGLAAFALPLAVSLGLLALYFQTLYGQPWPTTRVHAQGSYLNPRGPFEGLSGLLLDGGEGLLPYAPFWLLAFAGLAILYRRDRELALCLLLSALAVYLPAALYADWFGGINPPARYLVATTPFLLPGLAAALAWGGPKARAVAAGLAWLGLATAWYVMAYPSSVYGHRVVLDAFSQFPLVSGLLPGFIAKLKPDWASTVQAALWLALLVAGVFLLARGRAEDEPAPARRQAFWLAGAALALALTGAAAEAAWPGLRALAGRDQALQAMRQAAGLGPGAWSLGSRARALSLSLPPARFAHFPAQRHGGRVFVPAASKPGLFIWGQYLDLPAGRYQALAKVSAHGWGKAGWLEVSAGKGARVLARLDFQPGGQGGWVGLPFRLAGPATGCEIRLGSHGQAAITIDGLVLRYLPPGRP